MHGCIGDYVIRTSHTDWNCKTVAQIYWRLDEIEQTFRTMKSDLGLRPIYHRKKLWIEAHLFLCILAFHTAHLIRSKLGDHQIHSSWGTIKVKLNHQNRVAAVLPQNETYCILLKQDAKLKPFAQKVFQAMGLRLGRNVQKTKAKCPTEKEEEM